MSEKTGQFLACLIVAADEASGGKVIRPKFRAILNKYSRQHMRLVLGWPDDRVEEVLNNGNMLPL